jgi:hypothetical protein
MSLSDEVRPTAMPKLFDFDCELEYDVTRSRAL